jgi:hypothetical protein
MDNTNGHTIFVPLEGTVKIYYIAGDEFQVIDRNGTDADGATVEVPHADLDASVCMTYTPGPSGSRLEMRLCRPTA